MNSIKNEPDLTLYICSNRIDKILQYSMVTIENAFFKTTIIIDNKVDIVPEVLQKKAANNRYLEIVRTGESGLSNLRNLALRLCKTKYCLFIDDDVIISTRGFEKIIETLKNGFDIVGLLLVPPKDMDTNRIYMSRNQYHYLGLHTPATKSSIWGACMAFNNDVIATNKLFFKRNLDRQKKSLLSGGDTTFIAELKKLGCRSILIDENCAVHYIDPKRLHFSVLFSRIYWQGITEVCRNNTIPSIKKEAKRNFQHFGIKYIFWNFFWFSVFLLGLLSGYSKKIWLRLSDKEPYTNETRESNQVSEKKNVPESNIRIKEKTTIN